MNGRLPLEPLIRACGGTEHLAVTLGYDDADDMGARTNWYHQIGCGVTWQRADELACAVYLHPLEVWGDAWLECPTISVRGPKPRRARCSPRWGLIRAEIAMVS